jgi:hypothetical protein
VTRGIYGAACAFPLFVFAILNLDVARLGSEFVFALIIPVLVMDWRWMTSSRRRCRVSVVPSLVAAAITLLAALIIFSNEAHVIAAVGLATTVAMATQLLMPFSESRSHKVVAATDWVASLEGLAECVAVDDEAVPPEVLAKLRSANAEIKAPGNIETVNDRSTPAVTDDDFDVWWESAQSNAGSKPTEGHFNDPGEALDDQPSSDNPPAARMPALVLSLVPLALMPMCGLHRFYVGKVFSGVLYMATFGLFGIGQLIDVILIALGEFRDAEGRLLTAWRSSPDEMPTVGERVNSLSVVPSPRTFFSDGLALFGGLGLAATVMIGAALATDVPEMIDADVFRSFDLTSSDLQSIFGTRTWPELLRELLQLLVGIIAVVTAGLLMASRRMLGVQHMARVPAAFLPFGTTCGLLMEAFYRVSWSRVADGIREEKVGLILEEFLRGNDFIPSLIGAAVAFAVGLLILAWPPRRESATIAQQVRTPVEQGR